MLRAIESFLHLMVMLRVGRVCEATLLMQLTKTYGTSLDRAQKEPCGQGKEKVKKGFWKYFMWESLRQVERSAIKSKETWLGITADTLEGLRRSPREEKETLQACVNQKSKQYKRETCPKGTSGLFFARRHLWWACTFLPEKPTNKEDSEALSSHINLRVEDARCRTVIGLGMYPGPWSVGSDAP